MTKIFVKSVKRVELSEPVPVYDATVPKFHNFALANGVVVHNTAKYARYKEYQEVLKLKGKPLNSAKATVIKMAENEAINNLLIAIGYTPTDTSTQSNGKKSKSKTPDPSKFDARVNHIYLLADGDQDGMHINLLILTALWKAMPQLFYEHRVRVVKSPLYSASYKGKQYFADSLEDMRKLIPNAPSKCIARLKGWGEASADELREIAFDPATRKTFIILPPRSNEEDKLFYELVGHGTAARKEVLGL